VLIALFSALTVELGALAAPPDLSIRAQQYPDANAIILRWEQHWTVERDGTLRRRDHQWVKLLNRRPIRRYADRTIDYRKGEDQVVIHTAQTHLPDGTIQPVPDYGYNLAAAGAVAGWPEFADWEQRIVSFSGVQPGATLELDYEVITQAGVLPCASADVRLNDVDPVHERIVSVTVPADAPFHAAVSGVDTEVGATREQAGSRTHTWNFGPFPAARAEPLAPPWQQSQPRLIFSTAASPATWTQPWLLAVLTASDPDDAIAKFARSATESAVGPRASAEALLATFGKRFNYVGAQHAWRSRRCRPASAVFAANYGNPLESAAVCLAALRALGIDATPAVAVNADAWATDTPTDDAYAGVVLLASIDDGLADTGKQLVIHPEKGIVANPGPWGRHMLLTLDPHPDPDVHRDRDLQQTYVASRGEEGVSRLHVAGRVTLEADGGASGRVTVQLSGAFHDPQALADADIQKKRVNAVAGRIVDGFRLTDHVIEQLSEDAFVASANLSAEDGLPLIQSHRLLRLGAGPALLEMVPLPLTGGTRENDVLLPGALLETLELRIELPNGWSVHAMPQPLVQVAGPWGSIEQQVIAEGPMVRIVRSVNLPQGQITPQSYKALCDAINRLHAEAHRVLLAGPSAADSAM
jgi:hypothetical protein